MWSLHPNLYKSIFFGTIMVAVDVIYQSKLEICKEKKKWVHIHISEEFVDTKGVIRIRTSKKDKQHNGQKKKYKQQYTIHYT